MSRHAFEAAAAAAVAALGPERAKDLAGCFARGRSRAYTQQALRVPGAEQAVTAVWDRAAEAGVTGDEAAAYLRGFVAGWTRRRDEIDVNTVWSGPRTQNVPVRAMAQALVEVVREAREECIAMTYSSRAYSRLTQALADAVARGVRVDVVVETLAGAAGLLGGPEPADAFRAVPGVRLWHWPVERRAEPGARQHAKLAIADRRVLLLGSANLTASAVRRNMEAAVRIRGGTAPQRAAEHIRELQRQGVLAPLE
ncbi:DISARM system phospholipase D-like protein DrmC [Streptomyces sp. NBC_00444]|uniref:DISARM system phospholipase D-like protein DrmC n=1 Tax=Streptomyces sp. NBC_00444 TaxID=2975744 RepID=UPI002E1AF425